MDFFQKFFWIDIILFIIFAILVRLTINSAKKTKKELWINMTSLISIPIIGIIMGIITGGIFGYTIANITGYTKVIIVIKISITIMSGIMSYLWAWSIGKDIGLLYGTCLSGNSETDYLPLKETKSKAAHTLILSISGLSTILVYETLKWMF